MKMPVRKGAAEEGVPAAAWRRVSPLSPVLNSWKAITVIAAVVVFQNVQSTIELGRFAASHGPARIILYVVAVAVGLFVAVGIFSYFSWRAMTYAVTDQAVWMRQGIIFRQQRHVRLERIQSVDVAHPLLGRIFGLGRLTVLAAGGSGSSVEIGYLSTSKLEGLRADILARAAGALASATDDGEGDNTADTPTRAAREVPERLVYSVDTRTLIVSLLLGVGFIMSVVTLAVATVALLIVAARVDWAYLTVALPAWLPLLVILVSTPWARFSQEFNFEAVVSPDGIRVRRGLLEQRADTIPPRRIHAVRLTQPLLWRRRNWYRVTINQAARDVDPSSGSSGTSHVLLPVGTREEAMMALWLILPDLGVDDPTTFFDQAVSGTKPVPSFQGIAAEARFLDPLVKGRRGIALTRTCVVIRDGWLTRTASFVPYARVQSVVQTQGPLERRLRVSNVIAGLVPGVIKMQMPHLADDVAATTCEVMVRRSGEHRVSEPPERWFQRVKEASPVMPSTAGGSAPINGGGTQSPSQSEVDFRPPRVPKTERTEEEEV